MSNILITGGSGFVGSNLARYFAPKQKTIISYFQSSIPDDLLEITKAVQLDIRDAEEVSTIIKQMLPEVVIHAAGNKNVRYCEACPDEAYQTNALGTRNIARACRQIGAYMVYISTDLVFSCTEGGYKETDEPNPNLVYGKTKLQGEDFTLQELENAAICRSGGIYGRKAPLLGWLSSELSRDRVVECFTDIFNTPTYAENLAETISIIIQKRLSGIFHTVGREKVNRFQFFQSYARMFDMNAELLYPVQAGDQTAKMLLQPDSSLSSEQTSTRLGVTFNSVTEGFTRLKAGGGV